MNECVRERERERERKRERKRKRKRERKRKQAIVTLRGISEHRFSIVYNF